ncbi:hypothetical protein I3842_06G020600 [Carya illinoinensis]|uniref:TF-B3 domain-containing protein n=1 Tax=Carya illinoinensis TaxID=32201 RepID=A0A922ESI2_CARIL|nr:hypothetical protein I3842_06G020600 [Carya illinoinensis]
MAAAGNISKTRRSRMVPNWKYDHHRRPSSSVAGRRPAHFFKIMLPSAMAQKKLRIPVKFVRLFGDELPSTVVTLILPNGCSWQVGLERAKDKEIWFHDGWHDFVEYHSIDNGYFLVFRYEGNSNFHVLVFDKTATEIQYPLKNYLDNDDHQVVVDIMVSDEAVEKSSHDKSKETQEIMSKHEDGETSHHDRERPVLSSTSTKERCLWMSRLVVGRERAIQAAITFKPKNPSFMRVMRSSALYHMHVPNGFATSYLSLNQSVKLQTSDDDDGQHEWDVICRCHHKHPRLSLKLGSGWKVFARDNNLKEGDAFVFELIQRNPTVFKVSIFRVVDYV